MQRAQPQLRIAHSVGKFALLSKLDALTPFAPSLVQQRGGDLFVSRGTLKIVKHCTKAIPRPPGICLMRAVTGFGDLVHISLFVSVPVNQ